MEIFISKELQFNTKTYQMKHYNHHFCYRIIFNRSSWNYALDSPDFNVVFLLKNVQTNILTDEYNMNIKYYNAILNREFDRKYG